MLMILTVNSDKNVTQDFGGVGSLTPRFSGAKHIKVEMSHHGTEFIFINVSRPFINEQTSKGFFNGGLE